MHKYVSIIIAIMCFVWFGAFSYAQNSTGSATASSTATLEDENIKQLKEKVANKVAEMRKKDQKALSGIVKSVKDDVITISLTDGLDTSNYLVKVDSSLTQIFSVSTGIKKEMKVEDIKPNNYLIATGPIIDKTIQANTVYLDERYVVRSGTIIEVDKTEFSIVALSADKTEFTLDIEASTKQFMVNIKTLEIEKSGFSKLKEGDTIHFVGVLPEGKELGLKNTMTAKKYIVIPQEYFIK